MKNLLIKEFIVLTLLEGRVEDLKKKYPKIDVESLAEEDPSPTKKYLAWILKQISHGYSSHDVIPTIKFFDANLQRFKNKDVNSYKDLKDLENEVKKVGDKPTKSSSRESIKGNAVKLYEDEKIVLVRPDDKESVMLYGAGTKWCITMRDASYYDDYTENNVIFYFLISKKFSSKEERMAKVAFAVERRSVPETGKQTIDAIEIFDAEDSKIAEHELDTEYALTDILPDNIDVQSIMDIIKPDAINHPAPFMQRLEDGQANESEIIKFWTNKFKNSLDDDVTKVGLSYGSPRGADGRDKQKILKHLSIAQQKKIAKIDKSVETLLKSGRYVSSIGIVPSHKSYLFKRTDDNKIFYQIDMKEFRAEKGVRIEDNRYKTKFFAEAPTDGETCEIISSKDNEFYDYERGDKLDPLDSKVFDTNGKEYFMVAVSSSAEDLQKFGIDEQMDEDSGEITYTYPPII